MPVQGKPCRNLLFEIKIWVKEPINRDILLCLRHVREVSIPNSIEFDTLFPVVRKSATSAHNSGDRVMSLAMSTSSFSVSV